RAALDAGRPLPLALREARVWGAKERLIERIAPRLDAQQAGALVQAAQVCDGLVKGLRHPDWPSDPWAALRRLALMLAEAASGKTGAVLTPR
ncbi:MAG TPA: DNA polymerase III subunit delta, partial [Roseateles sp.]